MPLMYFLPIPFPDCSVHDRRPAVCGLRHASLPKNPKRPHPLLPGADKPVSEYIVNYIEWLSAFDSLPISVLPVLSDRHQSIEKHEFQRVSKYPRLYLKIMLDNRNRYRYAYRYEKYRFE